MQAFFLYSIIPFRRSKDPQPTDIVCLAAGLSIVYTILSAVAFFAGRIIARFGFRLGQRYRVIHIAAIGVTVVFLPLAAACNIHSTTLWGGIGGSCR